MGMGQGPKYLKCGGVRFGSWNTRTLINADGPVETASRRGLVKDDRKIDVVLTELDKYEIEVAGLQETKWFGKAMFRLCGTCVLSSGRAPPSDDEPCRRGEGVALVLRRRAIAAWRQGGSQWRACSSRLLTVKLKFSKRGRRFEWVNVVVAYAPTFRSPRSVKDAFFSDLQDAVSSVPTSEKLVILGDFNARVGSSTSDNVWSTVRGFHGVGRANESGLELLSFLSVNGLALCNTFFRKPDIHKATWQHPASKQWHCIDYIVVRRHDLRLCTDCRVFRGAQCNTDHQLLCATFHLGSGKIQHHASKSPTMPRFDVSQLSHACQTPDECTTSSCYRAQYNEKLAHSFQNWRSEPCIEEKWKKFKSSLIQVADDIPGRTHRRQPDWFQAKQNIIKPALRDRDRCHQEWLAHQTESKWHAFTSSRSCARRVVRQAKQTWLAEQADIAQSGRFSGKDVWNAIRSIQQCYHGLQPVRSPAIKKLDGSLCQSPGEVQERWEQHFTQVLNIKSPYDTTVLASMVQRDVDTNLTEEPTLEEVRQALMRMKSGKSPGASGIVCELVKVGFDILAPYLLDILHSVWMEKRVPQDWCNAVLVAVPKKGDLTICDNWRGISLLDAVGKLLGRVLQNRLQDFAANILPESQCGFRRSRSCTDQLFVVRQVIEKLYEHRTSGYLVFIDLRKAYDSVPREALWAVLRKFGVPDVVVDLIESFHSDMTATVRGGAPAKAISVENGLRQGCVMAPVLFNIFFAAVLSRWRELVNSSSTATGINITCSEMNGILFPRSWRNGTNVCLFDLEFADDAVLLASSQMAVDVSLRCFYQACREFGLSISFPKTKFLVAGNTAEEVDLLPITVAGSTIASVDQFLYLGSLMSGDSRCSVDVDRRLARASQAFGVLRPVLLDYNILLPTRRLLYSACVLSVLLYGAECWTPLKTQVRKLESFHQRCIRIMLNVSRRQQWTERITYEELRQRWGDVGCMADFLRRRRLEWLGHVARMPDDRLPKQVLFSRLPETRPACGPRLRWKDVVKADLQALGIYGSWYALAQDRPQWRTASCSLPETRPDLSTSCVCVECGRLFRRSGDMARHKCRAERSRPIPEQRGSRQCRRCFRWFRSQGGFAVHNCLETASPPVQPPPSTYRTSENCQHRRPTAAMRTNFSFVCPCGRRFRRQQDLTRHHKFCST